ncbi:hypothetical protein GQ44DRAFT_786356 [Phaeosphaeriaceae sp. PMI808]|nr:hypothetical protein GQ44DRAFT_786356 [Phaeosphaeriaceae sp. PMI808]
MDQETWEDTLFQERELDPDVWRSSFDSTFARGFFEALPAAADCDTNLSHVRAAEKDCQFCALLLRTLVPHVINDDGRDVRIVREGSALKVGSNGQHILWVSSNLDGALRRYPSSILFDWLPSMSFHASAQVNALSTWDLRNTECGVLVDALSDIKDKALAAFIEHSNAQRARRNERKQGHHQSVQSQENVPNNSDPISVVDARRQCDDELAAQVALHERSTASPAQTRNVQPALPSHVPGIIQGSIQTP